MEFLMLLAGAIFLFTLVLVIWQPRGLGIGWSASLGAILALLTGVVHLGDIPVVWQIVWNATATFIAVIIISLLLDESGFFEWAALHVARWGNGRGGCSSPGSSCLVRWLRHCLPTTVRH
jgi:arsenical pump membrane protein